MKNKKMPAAAMLLALLLFSACGDFGESVLATSDFIELEAQAVGLKGAGAYTEENRVGQLPEETEELIVYYSNGKADGLEMEVHKVDEVTPEEMIDRLSRHNIVSMDTKVLGFAVKQEGSQGRTVLELNLSRAFGKYLKTMGEDCEEVVLSALANTFLENYRADGIFLTVEGMPLETNHGVYDIEFTFKNLADGLAE